MTTESQVELVTRFVREGDESRLVELLEAAFEGWPKYDIPVGPVDHLRWKLEGHTATPWAHGVAEMDSRFAAAWVQLCRDVKVGPETVFTNIGTDASTHPDFRQMGIYSKLRAFILEKAPPPAFRFGRTHHAAIRHILESNKQRDPNAAFQLGNDINILMQVIDPARLAATASSGSGWRRNKLTREVGFRAMKAMGTLRSRPAVSQSSLSVRPVERFDERSDEFWREACQPYDFIPERSQIFLNWRYCDPRGGDHLVLLAEDHDTLLGYTALRISEDRGFVMDLLALPERNDVVTALIDAALQYFREADVAAVECWMTKYHAYNDNLIRRGFVDTHKEAGFACYDLRMEPEKLAFVEDDDAAIHVMDGDLF